MKDPLAVELGRRGGLARAVKLRAGTVAPSGGRPKIKTTCERCGRVSESVRAHRKHYCPKVPSHLRKVKDEQVIPLAIIRHVRTR
jgi:hypothetical protein